MLGGVTGKGPGFLGRQNRSKPMGLVVFVLKRAPASRDRRPARRLPVIPGSAAVSARRHVLDRDSLPLKVARNQG